MDWGYDSCPVVATKVYQHLYDSTANLAAYGVDDPRGRHDVPGGLLTVAGGRGEGWTEAGEGAPGPSNL